MNKRHNDDGLGLTEVVMAMLLLMIVMMAMLSLLVTAIQTTAANTTRATAAQAVQERMEQARAMAPQGSCPNLTSAVTSASTVVDGRGVEITVAGSIKAGTCTQTSGKEQEEPRLARVTFTATTTQPGIKNPVASTTTDIYIKYAP